MRLKENVRVQGITNELLVASMIAQVVYAEHGIEFVWTSCVDGKHSNTSLHYSGCGLDLRTRDMTKDVAMLVADKIRDRLTIDYDVLLEKDHLHIEYQPRFRQ